MSNQPRWAWWVVGIVIPVVGILVSIRLATNSGSGDDKGQPTNTGTSAPAASSGGNAPPASGGGNAPPANQPAKVLAGPVRVTLTEDAKRVDLDSVPPLAQTSDKGSDAWIGFNLPELELSQEGDVMATLSPEGPDPTRDDCVQAITKRGGSSSGVLAQGMRVCVQTGEGHTAYLRITAVPTRKGVTFEATVWE
ncbi:MAG: hypothetical protein HOV68_27965 [Streptomycetaceae bacterium]|nr:hypothetical protein [Streptomycetaceae bacterium]